MLSYYLITTVFLTKKSIKLFLSKKSRLSEIYFEEKIFSFVDIVDSQNVRKQVFLLV